MSDRFPHPLDTDIIEEIDVPVHSAIVDKEGRFQGIEQSVEKRQQITRYHQATISPISCKDGTHAYVMEDRHRYRAKCQHCTKNRFLRPGYETITDGHIVDADTGTRLD